MPAPAPRRPGAPFAILRHQPGRESEGRVVGARDHFRLVLEGKHAHDRPEDLLADDAHAVGAGIEDGRPHEVAAGQRAVCDAAAAGQPRPLASPSAI